ncbi:MAG: cytochrome C [Candidatus Thiodiazotropha sp. (ex Dulcina madagascariensis)]|nr:cytochrome C [Candidatus Thiodiazotropha sp. (ex Dulcina madagascariensis)]MCU7925676.1 cytochrome C [Candidatus Thiodiazotropha sp. (ex Dulcina madagascariensis)]
MGFLRSFIVSPRIGMCRTVAVCVLFTSTFPAVAAIQGSVHDLSASGLSDGEICNVCHVPHNTDVTADAPLWNHTISTAVYTVYNSPTMDVTAEQPGPGSFSRLCLSCHDGTIALDSYGGSTTGGTTFIDPRANLGTDLSDDHPVGIQWIHQTQRSGSDCFNCHDPLNLSARPGKELTFYNGKVECPSCHDVHNGQPANTKLLRKTINGSALCLHCHPK